MSSGQTLGVPGNADRLVGSVYFPVRRIFAEGTRKNRDAFKDNVKKKYLQGSGISQFKNIYRKNTIYCGFRFANHYKKY